MRQVPFVVVLGVAFAALAMAANLSFENRSDATVKLEIQGVMNPNLSPNSTSGATLERGQKVHFRVNGRRALLLGMQDEQDGPVVAFNELVATRSAELGENESVSEPQVARESS